MTNFEKKPVTTISPAITIVRLMRAARPQVGPVEISLNSLHANSASNL
jgi:hypothetical protein